MTPGNDLPTPHSGAATTAPGGAPAVPAPGGAPSIPAPAGTSHAPAAPAPGALPAPGVRSGRTPEQEAHDNEVRAAEARLAQAREAQARANTPKVTSFVGIPNGPFVIEGENLGNVSKDGGVRIGGITATVTAVRPTSIKGTVPVDIKPGKNIRVEVAGAEPFTGGNGQHSFVG